MKIRSCEGTKKSHKYCEKVFKFGYDKRVIRQVDKNHLDTRPDGY